MRKCFCLHMTEASTEQYARWRIVCTITTVVLNYKAPILTTGFIENDRDYLNSLLNEKAWANRLVYDS